MVYEGEVIKIFPNTDVESYRNWIVDQGFRCKVYSDRIEVGKRLKNRSFKPHELAELIYNKRTHKGYNRYKLAKMVGVTEEAVFNWEIARTQPKPKRIEILKEVLDISNEELERCRYEVLV